ncbi:helix-turn-helix domain-containing protein [Streptomyces hydrogenans]|uniref:helix-turn-helix domain-containing protein n=1 Tax=Streptomyces hydrogenans TaxID=1873719 RepID=UPI00167C8A71|nr:helix-turn-helix transcriptional regulator [Streptomyces hydrogenans]GHG21599.1 transcriptional regulator [Streptomyces hydrogenans]
MLEQPFFGRRLKQLRTERGLSQAALAGDGMSTGYLSRLESGARKPTPRAVDHLAAQLGADVSVFDEEAVGDSLSQALAIAASLESDETLEALERALTADAGTDQDPPLRWQALWLVARWHRRHNRQERERDLLEELVALGERLGQPALRVRGLAQLARCLRARGEVGRVDELAAAAHALAREHALAVPDVAASLLALVSVESEAGRLADARTHADELTALTADRRDTLWAEALWTGAAVRVRQGDPESAQTLLDQALAGFPSTGNLDLWTRLRVAAARLHTQKSPPELDTAERYLEQAESGLAFLGIPALEQDVTSLRAELAFQSGRFADARALLDRVRGAAPQMTYRNRVRLDILDGRLLIVEGEEQAGLDRMRALAEEAQASANIDLAADIWRLLAETLSGTRDRA